MVGEGHLLTAERECPSLKASRSLQRRQRRPMRQKRTLLHTMLALLLLQGALCFLVTALEPRSAAPVEAAAPSSPHTTAGVPPRQQQQGVTPSAAAAAAVPLTAAAAAQQKLNSTKAPPPGAAAAASPRIRSESAKQHFIVEGLSVDNVAAEAAARQAEQLPSEYATKGIIDPQSPLFSEDPGVLVPLAQGRTPVGDWLAAVEAAGPGTPLTDPMFVGTVFVPHNEAFEEVYPELRLSKLQGMSASEVLQGNNASVASLALQLNCLTVPGQALELEELWPGRLLRTAGSGAIKVIDNRGAEQPARLQHQPSGVYFSIVEPDLQSGSAVAHVIDVLPPATVLNNNEASTESGSPDASQGGGQYRSVMAALADPGRQLTALTFLVQRAALTGLLDSSSDAFTLFAPNDKAVEALLASLPVLRRQQLLMNDSLADAFVSSHLVLGTALGSKALEALLPAGQLRTPLGNMLVSSGTEHSPTGARSGGAVAIIEAGRQLQPAAAAAAAAAASGDSVPAAAAEAATAAPRQAAAAVVQPPSTTPAAPGEAHEHVPATAAAAAGEGDEEPSAAAAAAPPEVTVERRRLLSVADAGIIASDLMGGKAVLHVVDRVLISPALGQQLGLPPNQGYTELGALPSPAGGSSSSAGGQAVHAPRLLLSVATAAAAAAALALVM